MAWDDSCHCICLHCMSTSSDGLIASKKPVPNMADGWCTACMWHKKYCSDSYSMQPSLSSCNTLLLAFFQTTFRQLPGPAAGCRQGIRHTTCGAWTCHGTCHAPWQVPFGVERNHMCAHASPRCPSCPPPPFQHTHTYAASPAQGVGGLDASLAITALPAKVAAGG